MFPSIATLSSSKSKRRTAAAQGDESSYLARPLGVNMLKARLRWRTPRITDPEGGGRDTGCDVEGGAPDAFRITVPLLLLWSTSTILLYRHHRRITEESSSHATSKGGQSTMWECSIRACASSMASVGTRPEAVNLMNGRDTIFA